MLPTGRSTGNRFLPVASGEATNGLELRSPAVGRSGRMSVPDPAVGRAILWGAILAEYSLREATRRLRLATILAPATRQANLHALSPASRVGREAP